MVGYFLTMKTISIFKFEDYRAYLEVYRRMLCDSTQTKAQLEPWSKRLGYRSPRSIAMVIKGQRLPSATLVSRLSQDFKLNDREHRYFELLVEKARREKRGANLGDTLQQLQLLRGEESHGRLLSADQFSWIAEWYHYVLRQLIVTKWFREDLPWIQKTLRHKISAVQIRDAIERMIALGLVGRNRQGHLILTEPHIKTTQNIPSEALRQHQKQMLQRALEAIDEQSLESRETTSVTIAIDSADFGAAVSAIRKFRDEFHVRFHKPKGGNAVFQLGLQFFEHTSKIGH